MTTRLLTIYLLGMAKYQTWAEKTAEVRRKQKATLKAKQAAKKRPSAYGSAMNDVFDVIGQLAGVTNDWTGVDKKKRKKR